MVPAVEPGKVHLDSCLVCSHYYCAQEGSLRPKPVLLKSVPFRKFYWRRILVQKIPGQGPASRILLNLLTLFHSRFLNVRDRNPFVFLFKNFPHSA